MKKIILLFIIFSISFILNAQSFEWAFQGGGIGADRGKAITVDANNYIYTVADYSGNIMYGSSNLTGFAFGNFLLSKHDTSGNLIWVQKVTGGHGEGVSTDRLGNVYITGQAGIATFYGNSGNITASDPGGGDMFIAKYDSMGNILWVRLYGSYNMNDIGNAVKADLLGNTIITGYSVYNGVSNMFLNKYDTSGNLIWSYTYGSDILLHSGLDVDDEGNSYVTGSFYGNINFGGVNLIGNPYSPNLYIAKFSNNGSLTWVKTDGTGPYTSGFGISLDNLGNFYITGNYVSPSNFGNTTLNTTVGGRAGMFIAKYDTSGTNIWSKGASSETRGRSVSKDTEGNCFVTGTFKSTCSFGEGLNTVSITSAKHNSEIFVLKYDVNGNMNWVISPGGGAWESNDVASIYSDNKNNCYISGAFSGTTIFGNTTFNAPQATHGYDDIFIAKVKDNSSLITTVSPVIFIENNSFTISPNPTSGTFQINYTSSQKTQLQITITNAAGKIIYSETISQPQNEYKKDINMSKQAKGVYYIELIADKKREVRKMVVE